MLSIDITVARNFMIALLIGALVGIEREKSKLAVEQQTFGGLRTFILFALVGAVAAWLSQHMQTPWVFITTIIAVAAAVITGYVLENRIRPDSVGLTTEIAAIAVTLLGGVVMFGYATLAVSLAIITSAVLAFKQPLHTMVGRLDTDDIYAGLKLLIATFIVLPFLPNYPIDPWEALNPYKLWLLVILISSLSLVGYVAVRWLGSAHGTILTGLAGGLVSSTAVSLTFARRSQEDKKIQVGDALAAGILLAWMVMFVRVIIEVAVVNSALLPQLLIPYIIMAGTTAVIVGYFYWHGTRQQHAAESATDVPVKNPFSLSAAVKFGLFFAFILLVVKLTQHYFPAQGLYFVAGLAGLSDVDAITMSMADYARTGGDAPTAVGAIVIASLTNTVVKCIMVIFLGSALLRKRIMFGAIMILLAGALSLLFV